MAESEEEFSRDRMLADFQACSNIEDFDLAMNYLQKNDWNLQKALNEAISAQSSNTPTSSTDQFPILEDSAHSNSGGKERRKKTVKKIGNTNSDVVQLIESLDSTPTSSFEDITEIKDSATPPSFSSSSKKRNPNKLFLFCISFEDCVNQLTLKREQHISDLKSQLSHIYDIPTHKIVLSDWPSQIVNESCPSNNITDSQSIASLALDTITHLKMSVGADSNGENTCNDGKEAEEAIDEEEGAIPLKVKDLRSDRVHDLALSPSTTFAEVEAKLSDLTGIPKASLVIYGWYATSEPGVTIGQAKIAPHHTFLVSERGEEDEEVVIGDKSTSSKSPALSSFSPNLEGRFFRDDDLNDEDFSANDADDDDEADIYIDEQHFTAISNKSSEFSSREPLMPDDCTLDEKDMQRSFTLHFQKRYCATDPSCCPLFYVDSFEEALNDSCSQSRGVERKAILVYLHNDKSIFSNSFCSQVLCNTAIVNYLSLNFIVWAWDMSSQVNRSRFNSLFAHRLPSSSSSSPPSASSSSPSLLTPFQLTTASLYPLILVLFKSSSGLEVVDVRKDVSSSSDEFLSFLISTQEGIQLRLTREKAVQEERIAREEIKDAQDVAYFESLQADRAKKRSIQENKENEHFESLKAQAIKASLSSLIPEEPGDECPARDFAIIRFRLLPYQGEFKLRKFTLNTKLESLIHYASYLGYPPDRFKILRTWPRQDLSSLNPSLTLKDCNIKHQETLIFEEK